MSARVVLTLARTDTEAQRASRERYVAALERAGAEVLPIEPGDPFPTEFDALCLSGGEDVDPREYGEPPDPALGEVSPDRDALELSLLRVALAADKPVLGICRGFQVLNVGFGGSLVQHLEGHEATARASHTIAPMPGTLLADVCGASPFTVNSRHHQAVTPARLARGLRASAQVADLVEALESTTHRFVLGVQWHPERTAEVAPAALRVFERFVAASRVAPSRA